MWSIPVWQVGVEKEIRFLRLCVHFEVYVLRCPGKFMYLRDYWKSQSNSRPKENNLNIATIWVQTMWCIENLYKMQYKSSVSVFVFTR